MTSKPLYCTTCGAEDFACDCSPEQNMAPDGEYCDVTGMRECDCEYCEER